jgi:hypothetical protein
MLLSVEESNDYIQNDGEQNRKHTGGHDGKVKQPTTSFDPDVSGQSSKGDAESPGKPHSPADQDQYDPTNH